MKSITTLTRIFLLLLFAVSMKAADHQVRIAFIGNSITIGSGLNNPTVECYPSQLNLLLQQKYGDTCVIKNFAVSGRTMLKKGDFPIWNELSFKNAVAWNPNICYIMLGTNDSKPYNWDDNKDDFFSDYQAMIDTFRLRNPRIKFIVVRPCPAFGVVFDIRDTIIKNGVIPLVDSIAKMNDAEIVDFYHPLLDSSYLFYDKIHPNAAGAKVLAKIAYEKFISSDIIHKIEYGYAYVTSIQTNALNGQLRQRDTATISWTTIDADEVIFNGQTVAANGSIKVVPLQTTTYKIIAKNAKGSDSTVFTQDVYIPEVKKFYATPSTKVITEGDTISFSFLAYDQKSKVMTDTVLAKTCTITSGYGHFINDRDNAIDFIADSAGKVKFKFTIGTAITEVSLTIKEGSTAIKTIETNEFAVYPNPASDMVMVSLKMANNEPAVAKIYDLSGQLVLSSKLKSGANTAEIKLSKLKQGAYMLVVETGNKKFSKQIVKK